MQRNMDLVRMILMRIEASPSGQLPPNFGIEGYPPEWVPYHAHIMQQDGLIEDDGIQTGLTWKGHEFLDLARDPDRWNQAKGMIARLGGAPIAVWMKVLTDRMLEGVDNGAAKAI